MLLGTKKLGGTAHFLVYHVDETSKKWHFSPKIGTLQKFLRPKMRVLGAGWSKNFRSAPKTPKSKTLNATMHCKNNALSCSLH